MKKRRLFSAGFAPILLIATILGVLISIQAKAAASVVSVDPPSKSVLVGEYFTVDIKVDYAQSLYGFQVYISFDNTKLNATSIDYMGYLNEPASPWYQEVNNTYGYVALAVLSHYPATGKTGGSPPPLAKIDFRAIGVGSVALHLYDTVLVNDQGQGIATTTADGQVDITGGTGHDIAIANVIPNRSIAGKGYSCNITVTTENHGGYNETFNVTLHANDTEIATKEVTVQPAAAATVNFMWNTSSFAFGGYTIWAYAWPVPGETFTSDNNYTNGQVLVLWPGDIKLAYRKIDMKDIGYIAKRFGLPPSDPLWDSDADLNNDGKVDMKDIGTVAKYFGLTY
jgi:hypothetical protein